jgi:hypothetical protein
MRRGGRPGLLRTVGRTAVVAGTASATANAVNRRAQRRAADQQPPDAEQPAPADQQPADAEQPAPAPAASAGAPSSDLASQLAELGSCATPVC